MLHNGRSVQRWAIGNESERTGRRPRIGLALGAGVARGWAHIGILRALARDGLAPDVVAGTSIGAVVAGAYAAGALDPLEAWARSLKRISFFRYLDFRLRGSGLFGGQKLTDLMAANFGQAPIEALEIPFTAVACELATGHEIWLNSGPLVPAVQASFALPGAFEPVCIEGRWLADGALVNPVPVSVCRALGADVVVAVNLAEDLYGRARALREGMPQSGRYGIFSEIDEDGIEPPKAPRTLARKMFAHDKDAPSLFANMVASLSIMQNRLSRSRLAGEPPDVTVVPRVGHVGLMEFHRAAELIEEGEKAYGEARQQLEDALAVVGWRMTAS